MPFVKRDQAGAIVALYRERAGEAQEYLPPDHPQLRDFAGTGNPSAPGERAEMTHSDLDMIRVYEDLIDILVTKRIVVLTDFPQAAQAKLVRRKRLRSSFSAIADVLAPDDESGVP